MIAKIRAWLGSPTGWSLIILFIYSGLKAIQTHFTGSAADDIGVVLTVIGLVWHPTDMTSGRVISN